jgi:protein-tyrosine phosphatase
MSNWFRTYGFADVMNGLLIGAYPRDREDVEMLAWMRIECVLNLVQDREYELDERETIEQALAEIGIEEHRVSLEDHAGLPPEALEWAVQEVNRWLDEGRNVYLHCRAGWQRSAAVAAGVIALREELDIEDALDVVRARKPSADPLPHQVDDMIRWFDGRERSGSPEPSQPPAADGS